MAQPSSHTCEEEPTATNEDAPAADAQQLFPYNSDIQKIDLLREKYERQKGGKEIFKHIMPEPNPSRQNYENEEEIMATYKKDIDRLMNEITRVTQEKDEKIRRLHILKRLQEEFKSRPKVNRSHFSTQKPKRPVFLCPIPYCLSHVMNMTRHLKVANQEITTEQDKKLFFTLFEEMKANIAEQVGPIPETVATHNQRLLQKIRLDLPKAATQITQEDNEATETPQKEEEAAPVLLGEPLSRRHYKCPMCNKLYPSIGQHITRKHSHLPELQKNILRKNMVAAKTINAPARTIAVRKTGGEMLTANMSKTLAHVCKKLPKHVTAAITEFCVRQREVNYTQTLGLVKRIMLYCIRFGITNDRAEKPFPWSLCLSHGLKDLLTEENLNKLTVEGGEFAAPMKKKALTCIKKMLNFYEEAKGVLVQQFTLITPEQSKFIFTLIKARAQRLEKQEKERQTTNIFEQLREEQQKIPPMQEAFNACNQPAVKKVLQDIVRMGKGVEDGSLRSICRRSGSEIRELRSKLRLEASCKEQQANNEEEDEEAGDVETEASGQKFGKVSLQQYRRALILSICCQNARRSLEIVKYSVDEYYKDLSTYERQIAAGEDLGDNLTLHFM